MEAKKADSLNSSKSRRISGRLMTSIRKSFQAKEDPKQSESMFEFKTEGGFRKTTLSNSIDRQQLSSSKGENNSNNSNTNGNELIDILGELAPDSPKNNKTSVKSENLQNWREFESFATVIYPFEPNGKYQVQLKAGDKLSIQEQTEFWFKGTILSTGKHGIFPKSYVHLSEKLYDDPDPVMEELSSALWEWTILLKNYYRENKVKEFENMKQRLSPMLDWNTKIRSPTTEESLKVQLKNRVIDKIEEGRRFMGLDVIIRQTDGVRCTEHNTGIIDLLNKHIKITERDEQKKDDKKGRSREKAANCLVVLDFKLFACSVGEPTEVFCALWRSDTNTFISEDFLVTLTPQGMPVEVDRIGFIKAVFKDVLMKDIESGNIYCFIRLVRKGKLEKKGKIEYRIPFGGSLVQLKDITEKESEYSLPVYTTSEVNFWNLPELILKQKDVTIIQKAKGIFIGISLLEGLYNEQKESLFKVCPTEKYGFPDVILPGASRNDFYLTIESADFNIDRTIEVDISVKMQNGDHLPDCMRMGTSEAMITTFRSMILYHNNSPRWNEKISLLIPPLIYENCHVYFEIKTASATSMKDIAFGFMPLYKEDGTVIDDGHHEIKLYRMPKHEGEINSYLTDTSKLVLRKEVLHVNTLLCSTALTQYSYIRSLLKWKTQQSNLPEILNRLTFGSQFEIIKFFQEIFDSMFQILDGQIEGVETLVYDAIVFVIVILVDEKTSRFTNFRPVLDTYISKLFQSTSAHLTLLRCMTLYLDAVDAKPNNVLSTLKATTYLLKIIKKSLLLKNKDSNYSFLHDANLKSQILSMFSSTYNLMSKSSPGLLGAQTVALKNLTSWFEQLYDVFEKNELAEIACTFLKSIPKDNLKTKIRLGKLAVLSNLLCGALFQDPSSRSTLLPEIFGHLNHHMQNNDLTELSKCFEILSNVLENMYDSPDQFQAQILEHLIHLLPVISNSIELLKDHKCFLTAVTVYLNIFHLLGPNVYTTWVVKLPRDQFIEFLSKQCELVYWFCAGKTYPKNWFSLKMFQSSVVRKILYITANLLKNFDIHDATSLMLNFFQSAFAFLDSEPLKLETFTTSKRGLILDTYGDMRIGVCNLIKSLWGAIDTQNLIRGLIKEFLKISVIDQRELKELGVKLYFSALEKEYKTMKSFKGIEGQTIEAFSVSVGSNTNNLNYFFTTLEKNIQSSSSAEFIESSRKFLTDMKELCQHLIALNKSQRTGGNNDDDRTIATLSLMEYLKESNRITAYIRYVHSLVEQQVRIGNYLKAGQTLLLHSNLLQWNMDSKPDFQKESEFEKKISLTESAIDYFDQSEAWEHAVDLLGELYHKYQFVLFDYLKAADCLEKQAALYRKMISQERLVCEYFRVGYYGKDFPANIRNKEFIYSGLKLERIGEFTDRISKKFPDATLLKTTEPPGEDIRNGDESFIQIFTVKPECDDFSDQSKFHPNLPSRLRDYRISMINVNKFLYKRPFSKDKLLRKENEFKDLWTMNYYYVTKDSFPLITDRSEIVEVKEVEVTPLQNAIATIKSKNEELHKLSEQYKDSKGANISPFTMVLSGTVDAAVSGGLDNYKKAFLSEEFIASNQSQLSDIEGLKQLFQDHVALLSKCIVVHAAICPESLQQLQIHLEEKLEQLAETWGEGKGRSSSQSSSSSSSLLSSSSSSLSSTSATSLSNTSSPRLVTAHTMSSLPTSQKRFDSSRSSPSLDQPRAPSPKRTNTSAVLQHVPDNNNNNNNNNAPSSNQSPDSDNPLGELDKNWSPKLGNSISANSTAQVLKGRRTLIGSRRDD